MVAKKKTKAEEAAAAAKAADKAAKRKARVEALKNRPQEQRSNSKQVDIIQVDEKTVIKTYAYPITGKGRKHIGVLTTTVVIVDGETVSVSSTFVPGELTVKVKKGHGVICSAKKKKGEVEEEEEEEEVEAED